MTAPILEAEDLHVAIQEGSRSFSPVDGISLSVRPGESLGIVGESGSGKTLTLKALLQLLPANASVVRGTVSFGGVSVEPGWDRNNSPDRRVAMVFQEPTAALNPLRRVGQLIGDAHRATHRGPKAQARTRVIQLMREVGIPAPEERLRAYPHELSGGLRQRAMIAMALATDPQVLLCDEPTTALDVTVQRQIVNLLNRIRAERGLAMVYVTHDLAVIGEVCDRVAVMYAGRIVETGSVDQVFHTPAHPYSYSLLRSLPAIDAALDTLVAIPGTPPDPRRFPAGCRFHPRCPMARSACLEASYEPIAIGSGRSTACIRYSEMGLLPKGAAR